MQISRLDVERNGVEYELPPPPPNPQLAWPLLSRWHHNSCGGRRRQRRTQSTQAYNAFIITTAQRQSAKCMPVVIQRQVPASGCVQEMGLRIASVRTTLTTQFAQRLDFFAWCVRLSRLLVGFRTHFKSLHFHFISFHIQCYTVK